MEILEKIKENKITSLLILLILLAFIGGLFFVFQKNNVIEQTEINNVMQVQKSTSDENLAQTEDIASEVLTTNGKLMEITGKSITVLNLKKIKENSDLKEIEESMEIYNITASTPVTKGIEENVKSALYDLETGQNVTVDYDGKTMDAINININEKQI